jgi:pilus assembly protein CpaE
MHGVAVAVLAEDKERFETLQRRLEGTLGRDVFGHVAFPSSPTDSVLRQIQDAHSEIVIVDIEPDRVQRAIKTIELLRASTEDIAIFAIGEMTQAATIVAVMRAGAGEYLERNVSSEALAEAFARFTSARNKGRSSLGRARVFMVTNAKGGAGATTVAVNLAVALQETGGSALLIDFASLGHAALQLNVRPSFGLADALQNLHRLDNALLDGLLTPCKGGLQLLAGPQQPMPLSPTAAELARLFDLLVTSFRYVVVDCSNRADATARLLSEISNAVLLVAQADVVSLWSAARLKIFLDDGATRNRVRLVLNRYKKIPGFTDEDVEKATSAKLLWKLPNNYQSVSPAIDKGVPVVFQDGPDISRAFHALALALAEADAGEDGSLDLRLESDKGDTKKKSSGRLLVTPMRAGQ